MRLLLDTHAVLWWFSGHPALSPIARDAIERNAREVFVSAVSGLEVTTKYRIGKLPQAAVLASRFEDMVDHEGFQKLDVTLAHGLLAGRLAFDHKDPFDRLLIAQAQLDGLTLVSNETLFDRTGVVRLW